MTSVAIGIDPRGVPVAIKRPRDGRRAAAEVEALKAAARPGVVALVNFDALDNVITTEWVSGETLSSVAQSRRPPQHVAEIIASVAATLTELHAAGITHQRLDGSHVILEPSGHTTVLGFSGAALDNRGNPLDDVVALGRLLLSLLGTMTVAPRPSAGRRVLMPRQPRPDALVGLLRSIGQRGVDQPCTASAQYSL